MFDVFALYARPMVSMLPFSMFLVLHFIVISRKKIRNEKKKWTKRCVHSWTRTQNCTIPTTQNIRQKTNCENLNVTNKTFYVSGGKKFRNYSNKTLLWFYYIKVIKRPNKKKKKIRSKLDLVSFFRSHTH